MAGGLWLDGDLGSVCDSRQIISRDSSLASAVLTALGMDEDILCTRRACLVRYFSGQSTPVEWQAKQVQQTGHRFQALPIYRGPLRASLMSGLLSMSICWPSQMITAERGGP